MEEESEEEKWRERAENVSEVKRGRERWSLIKSVGIYANETMLIW